MMNARSRARSGGLTAAAALALSLAMTGCGETALDPGAAGPSTTSAAPTATGSPSPSPTVPATSISEDMLLTEDDLNEIGGGWRTVSTGSTDDGAFLRCQPETLADLGATEVLVRTFERPSSSGETTAAGHLIAVFPDQQALADANQAVNEWLRTCREHATGEDGEPHWVAGTLAVDTVHGTRPERPGSGETWGFTFDDDPDDEYGWFDSVGYGILSPYLTIVSYGDWGQDANYDLELLPGVVLLQEAFGKLPA